MTQSKVWILILAILAGTALSHAADAEKSAEKSTVKLTSKEDRISYFIGMRVGSDLKGMRLDVSEEALFGAISDMLAGREPALDDKDFEKVYKELRTHLTEVREKQEEEFAKLGEKAKVDGEAFLAKNAKEEGVIVSQSGLQVKVIKEGEGKRPNTKSQVKVHYKGTFIDGTPFDSSYERGEPSVFPVTKVIRGWTEALLNMKEGGKVRIFCPSNLAYGANGRRSGSPDSPDIPPNSVLIFDIEFIEIVQAPASM